MNSPKWKFGSKPSPRRAVEVGWLLDTGKAAFIWEAPRRFRRDDGPAAHAKALSNCPAIIDHEARIFEVQCPIDLQLAFDFDPNGQPRLTNAAGDEATVRSKPLAQMLTMANRKAWRHPDRPVIQVMTPYVFVADEPVYMMQLPPVNWYNPEPWPGTLIGGRLPIHIWPRQIMWAFEWFDTNKPLTLNRGDPWFNIHFEAQDPSRPIRLFEAATTPELTEYIRGLTGVSGYVNKTFSLFKTAQARRPPKLLVRRKRGS